MEESGRTENVSAENLGAENSGDRKIRPRIKVQLTGSEPFFGPGVRTLLEWIREEGSVRDACEKMGLSYSKGRKMLDRAEKELGYTIVERSPGGKNGGGARVSGEGLKLLEKYERFEQELTETAAEKYREIFH
ncbi:MAG TPA: LysR family transcriptional regulator [Candidatus Mediterraneibacter stercorigallinarum]|uniref:LysR family transcriptional regulator n=1 Tax=Candidatus Mediterraneibacter stercorigallinarum TaxID=2838686 RepID=A0A9D2DBA4_9FIRM|nr:LysR family transcriptional regulator [Candidatus Mediterraneibacter stercorigallinarum]